MRRFNLAGVPTQSCIPILPAKPPENTVASTGAAGAKDAWAALPAQTPVPALRANSWPVPRARLNRMPLWNPDQQRQMTALVDHLVNPFENVGNGVAIGRELKVLPAKAYCCIPTPPGLGHRFSYVSPPPHYSRCAQRHWGEHL